MKLRTLALALALSCGTTVIAEAKTHSKVHRVSTRRNRKSSHARRVKARKARTVKASR